MVRHAAAERRASGAPSGIRRPQIRHTCDAQVRDLRRGRCRRRVRTSRWSDVGGRPAQSTLVLQIREEPGAAEPPGLQGRHEEGHNVLALHEQLQEQLPETGRRPGKTRLFTGLPRPMLQVSPTAFVAIRCCSRSSSPRPPAPRSSYEQCSFRIKTTSTSM